ncbi:MAG: phosphodiester glycosidase family protein [Bacteroidales bacterium]|nr:phosphodiester glycosidase family protein [Bacteroidales bacterium]
MKKILITLIMTICSILVAVATWQQITPGLSWAEFELGLKSEVNNSTVTIVKIDPQQVDFGLYCETEHAYDLRNLENWVNEFDLICAINAGMFQKDYTTGCGLLKNYGHVNNPVPADDYKMYFVCNPVNDSLPEAQMVDIEEAGAEDLIAQYYSILQSIRMVSHDGRNVWSKQSNMWSEAALGEDGDGNILFIHCRSPYTMHDFINEILKLPINLGKMMHLEGGWEAGMILDYKKIRIERIGSYETNFYEEDGNDMFYQVPNVIGVKKKNN